MYSPSEEQHRMVGCPAIFFFFWSDGVKGRSNPDPTSVFEIPLIAPRLFEVVIHDAHCMHRAGRHAKPAETPASAKRGVQRRKARGRRARTRRPTNALVAILLPAILDAVSGTRSCAVPDEKIPRCCPIEPGSWILGPRGYPPRGARTKLQVRLAQRKK
jgi:hypothetical protein